MKNYIVNTTCTFNGLYWERGKTAAFDDKVKPPQWFTLVSSVNKDKKEEIKATKAKK